MLIEQARSLVDEHIAGIGIDLGDGAMWCESRFADGWILVSSRKGITGGRHFIVMDEYDPNGPHV